MLNICSLFQGFFGFIKNINKKAYRTQAVILVGAVLVAVICFCAKDFGGSGKNASTANRVTKGNVEAVTETDETDAVIDVIGASLLPIEREQVGLENSQTSLAQSSIDELNYLNKSTEVNESEKDSNDKIESFKNNEMETNQSETLEKETETQTEEIVEETVTEETTENNTVNNQVSEAPIVEKETVVVSATMNSCVSMTDEEYQWLLKIVEAEAGDQDDIGKILVVNVIFNRVRSGKFPNSVTGVIFQNSGRTYQFQPVKNGRIYDMNPSQNTIDCVNRAMSGEDYSEGALFFTMRTSSNSWFNTSLNLLFVHGDHYFYTYY
ncbi:MAG: cell wall hydrolase [Lachnospiraceae bacterium]|nr:cell wall hydrolase [Lachnospiraceae bacterium]